MTEPFYVVQTAEPEHTATTESRIAWFKHHSNQAKIEGATFPRYSLRNAPKLMLLFEAWKTQPKDQGAQRWALTEGLTVDG